MSASLQGNSCASASICNDVNDVQNDVISKMNDDGITIIVQDEATSDIENEVQGEPESPLGFHKVTFTTSASIIHTGCHKNEGGDTSQFVAKAAMARKLVPKDDRFYCRDVVFALWALFTFAFDYGTDVGLAVEYANDREYLLFILTLFFIAVPSIISGVISIIWYKMTYQRDIQSGYQHAKSLYCSRIVVSFLQFGRIFR